MVYNSDMDFKVEDLCLLSWKYSTGLDACKHMKNFFN